MRKLIIACLLLAGAGVHACEITAGPGSVVRLSEGKSGGLATIGCVFDQKWEVRAYWIGEQRIYDGAVVIDAYPALSVSKLWTFREGKRFQPMLGAGLLVKGSQRCHYNGDINCNRQMPLPFAFLATAGFKWGDVLVTFGHASNASLDYGEEKKNLGFDHIRAEVWF